MKNGISETSVTSNINKQSYIKCHKSFPLEMLRHYVKKFENIYIV